jgi:hypothetical protein
VLKRYPFGLVETIGGFPIEIGVLKVITSEVTLPDELLDTIFR